MALNISAWSIRNPLPSIVFSIILLVLGWVSFTKLAVTRLPSADIPVISVAVAQFGAAPAELESQVTKTIEDGVSGVEGGHSDQGVLVGPQRCEHLGELVERGFAEA